MITVACWVRGCSSIFHKYHIASAISHQSKRTSPVAGGGISTDTTQVAIHSNKTLKVTQKSKGKDCIL